MTELGGEPLLRVDRLLKQYPVRRGKKVLTAVNRVSFALWPGETLALVGESGSGKTTIGRCVLRTLSVTAGAIWFDGQDITQMSQRELRPLRAGMQAVFQDPFDSLNPRMRVGAIVEEPLLEHFRLSAQERSNQVMQALDRTGIRADLARAYPAQLTPSQQQRVAIARAIVCEPKLLVLDEPTSSLDPLIRSEVLKLLVDLQSETGISYLLISHDLVSVRHIAHRIAVMYLGEIVEQGAIEQVYEAPSFPYTRALLDLAPSIERKLAGETPRVQLAGEIPSPIDLPPGCYLASRCPFVLAECSSQHPELEAVAPGHHSRCLRETGKLPPISYGRHSHREDGAGFSN
jgi:oligopeptide/dipeptide ABC transporter ATP-binding protein